MKVAFPLLATLALVAASPTRLDQKRADISTGFDQNGDNVSVPIAVDGKCDDGWTLFNLNGKDLCCPPGNQCDKGGVRPEANDDVDVQNNIWVCRWWLTGCDFFYCYYRYRCVWV
ncbi:hypothetical protein CspHIS471_0507030 [Cutaneotrichosporon sp. HIS471]|nr:hypothetical protein CspHIS471_0507030 [Cutaneotrichosporon sp. HIS471]